MRNKIESLDRNFTPAAVTDDQAWYDIVDIGIEGRGFTHTLTPFDRLPARAQGVVRPEVWMLSQHSAGLSTRFVTDATSLAVRWSFRDQMQPMQHMAGCGVGGMDLYVRSDGKWRYQATTRPNNPHDNTESLVSATSPLSPGKREFVLYLPLYSGVRAVSIGLPHGAMIHPAPPWPAQRSRPITFYGTSIVQGGCASRPGMAYSAILSRLLDWPAVNLGFSGNGRSEIEMAHLLAEVESAAFVIDPLPNMTPELVHERMGPFIRTLRQKQPHTPIMLVENITYQRGEPLPHGEGWSWKINRALADVVDQLRKDGITGLHEISGAGLLGDDGDGTVDGTHPTDLGFYRMAHVMYPILQSVISQ